MKRKRCRYDFVEVMACPSGCLNGGAQCRPADAGSNPKEVIAQLDEKYKSLSKERPDEVKINSIYNDWLGGRATDKSDHFLYTDYHEVEKMTNSLAIKW